MGTKRHHFLLVGVLVALAAICAFAGERKSKASDSHTVNFITPTRVGDVVLPEGEYRVIHSMEGDQHVLEFVQVKGSRTKSLARANCKLVPLQAKAERTEVHYKLTDKQERVLTGLVFQGEQEEHTF